MLAVIDYPALVAAIMLFLAIPWPGNLAILSSTAQRRVRGGLAATLGNPVGWNVSARLRSMAGAE
jgi:threonine/homoserine/homoserine lactone efflux protein